MSEREELIDSILVAHSKAAPTVEELEAFKSMLANASIEQLDRYSGAVFTREEISETYAAVCGFPPETKTAIVISMPIDLARQLKTSTSSG